MTTKVASRADRERIRSEAGRLARTRRTAPTCDCGLVMLNDSFNGMWYCREQGHGGYQTQEQVTELIYAEMMRNEGYEL
jgi:hypothetical protein